MGHRRRHARRTGGRRQGRQDRPADAAAGRGGAEHHSETEPHARVPAAADRRRGRYDRQAAQSNMPHEQAFWDSRQRAVDNPSVDMMNTANAEGYRLTYISDVGQAAQKIGEAIRATKVGQLVMPFLHIPFNILARGAAGTPIGLLSPKVRADLMGGNGAVAQYTAVARMIAGSAVGAWGVSMVANDRMSGFGPTDPK